MGDVSTSVVVDTDEATEYRHDICEANGYKFVALRIGYNVSVFCRLEQITDLAAAAAHAREELSRAIKNKANAA